MPVDVIVRTSLAMNSTFFPDGPWPPGGLGQLFEIGLTSTVGIAGCGGTPPSSAFTVAGRDSSSSSRSDETIATRCRSCSSSNRCAAAVQAAGPQQQCGHARSLRQRRRPYMCIYSFIYKVHKTVNRNRSPRAKLADRPRGPGAAAGSGVVGASGGPAGLSYWRHPA
jgi:hypothetical protein